MIVVDPKVIQQNTTYHDRSCSRSVYACYGTEVELDEALPPSMYCCGTIVPSNMRYTSIFSVLIASSAFAQWTQLPDFPGTPRDDAASFVIDGKIYVGTGREVGFGYTNDWFCYDPGNDTWSSISTMPATPRQYCTAFTIADTGYVFGGTGPDGPNNELWAYHPESDQWEQKASLPAEARYACVGIGMMWADALIASGMLASGLPTNQAWKYLAQTDEWIATGDVPGPARHRAACVQGNGGGMLLLGGADSTFTGMRDAWLYPSAFETGSWYPADSIPEPRWGADGSGSYVYVLACGATDQSIYHADVWKFGTIWNAIDPFPAGTRRGGVAAGLEGPQSWANSFYYGLGLDGTFARRNDWWRLDLLVGINEQSPLNTFQLFPVPTNSELNITVRPEAVGSEIRIATMDGRLMDKFRIDRSTQRINVDRYLDGMYTLSLHTSAGSSTHRFIVQH